MNQSIFESSATFQDLQRFLAEFGCAICRCSVQAEERYLDALLYENASSPATEERMLQSNGFCGRHLETLLSHRDPLGTAIIYRIILLHRRRELAKWRKARVWGHQALHKDLRVVGIGLQCPACEAERGAERRAYEVLAAGLDTGALLDAFKGADGWAVLAPLRGHP